MITLKKNSIIIAAGLLLFLITGLTPYQQEQLHHFTAYAGEGGACIDHDQSENAIIITCNASFSEVANTINDPAVLEQLGDGGEYLLKASLQVDDGATLSIGPNDITWLKITGTNGITVYGKIHIVGVKITAWGTEANSPISQTITGSIPRAFLNLRESEGGFVHNSEIAYLGYQEFGRRGFDLFGDGPSHDLEIRGSKFHDMWFAFYSREAYNITVDGNEYYNNIKYALDPHTITHDMVITNNWLHDNPIGAICSDRCYDILIEGNLVEDTTDIGIFFSRNMTDSIARNNHVINARVGILVSESPNNQIYNNTIEEATSQGIRLLNPDVTDDGVTEGNIVYNNVISSSEDGIAAARSQNNIVENTTFSDIESSEYHLSGNSALTIRGQQFDDALVSGEAEEEDDQATEDQATEDQATENVVEIVGSGTIEVTGGANDGEEDGDDDGDEDEDEANSFNTDVELYTTILGDGDSITVNS